MSRPLSRWQALILGLVVVVGLTLAAVAVFAVGSRGWFGSNALRVQAAFREIKGVEVGTRIRIHGIDAGEVVGIERQADDNHPVLLRLLIKHTFREDIREGSTVRIVSEGMLGTKSLEIRRPRSPAPPVPDGATLASEPNPDLGDVLAQVNDALKGLKSGDGTLGKLVTDPRAYEALVVLLEAGKDAAVKSKETMSSLQRDADALKKVPILGGYIEDPTAILVRANFEKNRKVFSETELFEKGRAVLTTSGRARLDEIAPWLLGLKHSGSEVVVVAYADPKEGDGPGTLAVTRQQSTAVADYLKSRHKVHHMGYWGWSTRKVTTLGQGTARPPMPETDPLPAGRVEVIVFVPQS